MGREDGETLQPGNTPRYMQAHLAGQAPNCQSTLTAWHQPWGVWGAPHSGHGGLSVSSPLSEGLQRQEPAHPPECATQMEMAEGITRGSSHPGVDVETLQMHQDRCSALGGVPQHIHSTSHQARALLGAVEKQTSLCVMSENFGMNSSNLLQ